ncbi:hypothetical protein [Pontiella sp.]|uniref:hypothetical protein n=1 Tax=Pontiella sp. TaxID=2837462 RepID=UPI00356B15A1
MAFLLFILSAAAVAAPLDFRIVVTRQDPSMDWWYAVPEPFQPAIAQTDAVYRDEYFRIIPFFDAYATDSNHCADLTFDLEVVRPDGTVKQSLTGNIAHRGVANGTLPAQSVVQLCFDHADDPGNYTISITARDQVSGTTNRQSRIIEQKPVRLCQTTPESRDALFLGYAAAPDPVAALSSFLQTEPSFFDPGNEPVWSAIWFYKTIFENNEFLVPQLIEAFPAANRKQRQDTILLLTLLHETQRLPRLSQDLVVFKRLMEAGQVPDPYAPAASRKQLDMLWAEFFATGRIRPLEQIVSRLGLVDRKGTLQKIEAGELDPADESVRRAAQEESVFQSALITLRQYATDVPLVLHYCIGILDAEELEKPAQECLAMLIRSVNISKQESTP